MPCKCPPDAYCFSPKCCAIVGNTPIASALEQLRPCASKLVSMYAPLIAAFAVASQVQLQRARVVLSTETWSLATSLARSLPKSARLRT